MIFLLRRLLPVSVTTLLLSLCCCGQAPPNQFHGRTQPSSLDSFFGRALGLVNEVNRLLSTAENDEDVVEYCIARLEKLLTDCVNLFRIIEEQQYNSIINAVQTFLFMLRSRIPGDGGRTSSAYSAHVHGFAVGRPPYDKHLINFPFSWEKTSTHAGLQTASALVFLQLDEGCVTTTFPWIEVILLFLIPT